MFTNKRILVTGSHGSIGSEIVCELIRTNPHQQIVALGHSEIGMETLRQKIERLFNKPNVEYAYGDIREFDRMCDVTRDIDIVFHAAAMKHVGLCEWQVWETIKTNVIGTHNLITAADANGVEAFVGISTDKAADPSSIMGLTKALVERMIIAKNLSNERTNTKFYCVRFGNVLGSSGSVYPIFKDAIQSHIPIKVTGRDMTRFVMTIPQAVKLVLSTYEIGHGGEIFVLKMPKLRILDLAQQMTKRFGDEHSTIEICSPRYGEKNDEILITDVESQYCYDLGDKFAIFPKTQFKKNPYQQFPKYTEKEPKILSNEEITRLIDLVEKGE